jgi:hypothetical protein
MLQLCDMQMQRAFQPPPTQHTVNQAAGVAGKAAAAAAAVQPAKALLQDSTLTSGLLALYRLRPQQAAACCAV